MGKIVRTCSWTTHDRILAALQAAGLSVAAVVLAAVAVVEAGMCMLAELLPYPLQMGQRPAIQVTFQVVLAGRASWAHPRLVLQQAADDGSQIWNE